MNTLKNIERLLVNNEDSENKKLGINLIKNNTTKENIIGIIILIQKYISGAEISDNYLNIDDISDIKLKEYISENITENNLVLEISQKELLHSAINNAKDKNSIEILKMARDHYVSFIDSLCQLVETNFDVKNIINDK